MVSLVGAREDIATTLPVATLPIAWRFKRRATQLSLRASHELRVTHTLLECNTFKRSKNIQYPPLQNGHDVDR